jgi:beta-phosphoglucomutase
MIKAFLFDLDGVITDTSEFHFLAWQKLGEDLGISFSREDNEALRGVSRRESLRLLLNGLEVTEDDAAIYMERKNNYYLEQVNKMGPENLLPGAVEILAETRAMGLKIAIVSVSKNSELVLEKLGIRDLIDGLIDGHAPARSKPYPDLFLLGAQLFGFEPSECLVVEDATAGIQAAHAAGMKAVGLGPIERVGEAELILPSLEGQTARGILDRLDIS